MSRRDDHLDAMLRHLGAVYYHAVRGEAAASDVARALEQAEAEDASGSGAHTAELATRVPGRGRRRWRVRDVMTTDVVTVDKNSTYKRAAMLMTRHKVNALPVVTEHGRVLGMVSEADILRKQERKFGKRGSGLPRHTRGQRKQMDAVTVAQLMSAPAITTYAEAPLGAAARLMNAYRIRRLPVVDSSGALIGIVSRRDLLSVFLRPDEEIAADVREALTGLLLQDPGAMKVAVLDGVVTISGSITRESLIPFAVEVASDVDGVVSVVSKLTVRRESAAVPAPEGQAGRS